MAALRNDYVSTACLVGAHKECERHPVVVCDCGCHRRTAQEHTFWEAMYDRLSDAEGGLTR